MTKHEADMLMMERFETMVAKAQSSENIEDIIRFTDCAHKLYITLSNAAAFSAESGTNPEFRS